jgi:hypothetical protein
MVLIIKCKNCKKTNHIDFYMYPENTNDIKCISISCLNIIGKFIKCTHTNKRYFSKIDEKRDYNQLCNICSENKKKSLEEERHLYETKLFKDKMDEIKSRSPELQLKEYILYGTEAPYYKNIDDLFDNSKSIVIKCTIYYTLYRDPSLDERHSLYEDECHDDDYDYENPEKNEENIISRKQIEHLIVFPLLKDIQNIDDVKKYYYLLDPIYEKSEISGRMNKYSYYCYNHYIINNKENQCPYPLRELHPDME